VVPRSARLDMIRTEAPARIMGYLVFHRLHFRGNAMKWGNIPVCGAKTRQDGGRPCRRRPMPGKRRCRNHGGCSLKPRAPLTEAGKKAISQAQKERWRRWRANNALADTSPLPDQGESK
jgi:hypothetical protein